MKDKPCTKYTFKKKTSWQIFIMMGSVHIAGLSGQKSQGTIDGQLMTSASAFVLMQFSCVQSTGTLYCQKIIFILSACILFGICSIKNEHFWCEGGGNKASPQITAFLQKRMPPLCTTDLRDRSGGTHEVHQSGS